MTDYDLLFLRLGMENGNNKMGSWLPLSLGLTRPATVLSHVSLMGQTTQRGYLFFKFI